jgi:GDP/UDP-N,N'-diacetylbacillosamine 2-epimerase (hydrolysing)
MRNVLFVTGIRSEYDILYSVIRAVDATDGLHASVLVTGAHLSPMYGYSVREIERDGVTIAGRLETLLNADSKSGRVKSAAIQLPGIIDLLVNQRPDFVVAPMDREEAITVAVAGAYLGVPVVHIGGGDTAEDGNIDNAVRHAVTKLSHLHMVTTARSAERVMKLGEEPWRVHVVGAPGLDRLLVTPALSDDELWSRLGFHPSKPFALLIQHSIISSAQESGRLMELTMEALLRLDVPTFVSYPNSDPGSQQIIEVVEHFTARHPGLFCAYRNLGRLEFVNLMRRARVMVGNSSAGIIEAPLFKLPTVNIGARQRGREHSDNVQFVDHDPSQIEAAVRRAVEDADYRAQVGRANSIYGDGTAGRKIAAILAGVAVDQRLIGKVNTY